MTEITVTQQDIDAAKRIVREFRQEGWPAKEEELAAFLSRFRREALKAGMEEAAGIADDQAVRAWEIGEAEGQNAVCSSGRNHGARAIAIAIRSAIGGENP